MDQRSIASLAKLFEQYRIVFWYDDKKTLRDDYEALEMDGVTKVELVNNEFSLKYRLLREETKKNSLSTMRALGQMTRIIGCLIFFSTKESSTRTKRQSCSLTLDLNPGSSP